MAGKYDIKLNDSANVSDVFFDEFDLTWMHGMPKDKRTFTKLPIENIFSGGDDGSISYNYNQDGFRSDEFSNEHVKYHILFSGCSQTEGVGGSIDTVWTNILHKQLKDRGLDVGGFYTLARSGYGWQKIISQFMLYTKKYGMPTHFFVLMPNIGRFYLWSEERNNWVYVQRYPVNTDYDAINDWRKKHDSEEVPEPSRFEEQKLSVKEHREKFLDFVIGWKLFSEYCKANNVKLVWSSWDYAESDNYSLMQSNDFFPLNESNEIESFISKKRPDLKLEKYDLIRRDGHDGVLWHEYWAEKFLEKIDERDLFND